MGLECAPTCARRRARHPTPHPPLPPHPHTPIPIQHLPPLRPTAWGSPPDRPQTQTLPMDLEAFLETFVGFASTSQGETASNVPQNGPHQSRIIPGRQRHPRPSRPEYDPIEAARVQKLYRTNRRKCMNHILKGKSPPCPLDGGTIINHLRSPAGGAPLEDVANVRGYLAHIKSRECTGNRQSNALLPSSAVNGRAQPQPAAETNLPVGSEMPLNSVCVEAPRSSGGATPLATPPENVSRAEMGHVPATATTTETTQGVINPVDIATPTLAPSVQAEVPRRSGMGLPRTERAAKRARGSRGSRGSRGTPRGSGKANRNNSLPDSKLSQQQKTWISKVRTLDEGDDAGWDDVISELMRAAGDSTPTSAPTDDTLSAEPSVTAK